MGSGGWAHFTHTRARLRLLQFRSPPSLPKLRESRRTPVPGTARILTNRREKQGHPCGRSTHRWSGRAVEGSEGLFRARSMRRNMQDAHRHDSWDRRAVGNIRPAGVLAFSQHQCAVDAFSGYPAMCGMARRAPMRDWDTQRRYDCNPWQPHRVGRLAKQSRPPNRAHLWPL